MLPLNIHAWFSRFCYYLDVKSVETHQNLNCHTKHPTWQWLVSTCLFYALLIKQFSGHSHLILVTLQRKYSYVCINNPRGNWQNNRNPQYEREYNFFHHPNHTAKREIRSFGNSFVSDRFVLISMYIITLYPDNRINFLNLKWYRIPKKQHNT